MYKTYYIHTSYIHIHIYTYHTFATISSDSPHLKIIEVSVVLVETIQQTRRSALHGFDPFESPFGHHSRIRPEIWPRRASQPPGREVSSKTEETFKIRRGSNKWNQHGREIIKKSCNPNQTHYSKWKNESKHTLRSSYITLEDPSNFREKDGFSVAINQNDQNVTQSLAGGTWKLWMKWIDFWFFDKKPSGPLVGPPISYLSSLLVVAFVEYLKKIGRCWWLKDWRRRAGIRFPGGATEV